MNRKDAKDKRDIQILIGIDIYNHDSHIVLSQREG